MCCITCHRAKCVSRWPSGLLQCTTAWVRSPSLATCILSAQWPCRKSPRLGQRGLREILQQEPKQTNGTRNDVARASTHKLCKYIACNISTRARNATGMQTHRQINRNTSTQHTHSLSFDNATLKLRQAGRQAYRQTAW